MPIFDRYGMLAAAVRGVPSIGDGAQFVVSIAATFEFFGMTHNLALSARYEGLADTGLEQDVVINDCRYSTEYGNYELSVGQELSMPASLETNVFYTCYFAAPRNLEIEIVDSQGRRITFPCQMRVCRLKYDTIGYGTYYFPARTQRMANLNRPYDVVRVRPLDEACTAVLTVPFQRPDDELIHEDTIDYRISNELRLFESLNQSLTRRFERMFRERDTHPC
jgi:hypothetical protein